MSTPAVSNEPCQTPIISLVLSQSAHKGVSCISARALLTAFRTSNTDAIFGIQAVSKEVWITCNFLAGLRCLSQEVG